MCARFGKACGASLSVGPTVFGLIGITGCRRLPPARGLRLISRVCCFLLLLLRLGTMPHSVPEAFLLHTQTSLILFIVADPPADNLLSKIIALADTSFGTTMKNENSRKLMNSDPDPSSLR